MAINKLKFLRMKHVIRTLEYDSEGTVVGFEDKSYMYKKDGQDVPSISAAKRASRELQKANGGLGMGSLKRVDKFPAVREIFP